MLAYPILVENDNGAFLVTCPDFPELTTFADSLDEAPARASDALEEAIAARMHDNADCDYISVPFRVGSDPNADWL